MWSAARADAVTPVRAASLYDYSRRETFFAPMAKLLAATFTNRPSGHRGVQTRKLKKPQNAGHGAIAERPGLVKNHSPGYMEQAPSRGHEASPQSGLGVGYKLFSSSKKLRGLSARAQARRISIPPLFSVLGFS